jgi:hypothetical protein
MVLYVFNFAIIFGVGFLVMCLRHFAQEARSRHHAPLEKLNPVQAAPKGIARPIEVLRVPGTTRHRHA